MTRGADADEKEDKHWEDANEDEDLKEEADNLMDTNKEVNTQEEDANRPSSP